MQDCWEVWGEDRKTTRPPMIGRPCAACQKSPKDTVSFRTSPQTGVGIPRLNVKAAGLGLKIFEYQGDCHASVSTGVAMTWFFDNLKVPQALEPGELAVSNYSIGGTNISIHCWIIRRVYNGHFATPRHQSCTVRRGMHQHSANAVCVSPDAPTISRTVRFAAT